MSRETDRLYYSISEVCEMTGLKSHVLRYWETVFTVLKPHKNQAGNRIYREKDIKLIKLIKKLLYNDRFTMDGAKKKLEELKNNSVQMELGLPREDRNKSIIAEVRKELNEIISILDKDPMVVDGKSD